MSRRPPSVDHNPLAALRRVVGSRHADDVGGPEDVNPSAPDPSSTVRLSAPVATAVTTAVAAPAETAAAAPAEALADRRPPGHLITSTPAAQAAPPGPVITPAQPRPITPRAAAGPWSTISDAPMTTPTWLRSRPGREGATATATGNSAIVTNAEPARRGGRTRRTVRARLDPKTGRRPLSARQAMAAMLICLSLWGVVDAPTLLANAESSQLGTRRTVALDVLRPLSRLSAALGLDRVDHAAETLIGRDHKSAPAEQTALGFFPDWPRGVGATTLISPTPTPAPINTGLPPLPIPTAASPLRVLVVGDSIGLSFGESLATMLDATGVVTTKVDGREGTGLSRPDAFDWPVQIQNDINQTHPELVVAMFGGNDDQDTYVNGRDVPFNTPQWDQLYSARVAAVADEVHAAGAHLLWSGLPIMRSAAKTARFTTVMNLTRAALAGRDATAFVDNYATLAGPQGQYVDALANASGQEILIREPDGIHPSPGGADRLAAHAIAVINATWHLDL